MEEFNEAQHNQERMRGVLHDSREFLESSFVEFKEPCRRLEDAGRRVAEANKKRDFAHDQIRAHRSRCRRVSTEYRTVEEGLIECLGRVGRLIRDCGGGACVVVRHGGPGH